MRVSDQSVQKTIHKIDEDEDSILLLFVFLAQTLKCVPSSPFRSPIPPHCNLTTFKVWSIDPFSTNNWLLFPLKTSKTCFFSEGLEVKHWIKMCYASSATTSPLHLRLKQGYQPFTFHVFSLYLTREGRAIGCTKYYVLVQ